MNRKWRKIVPVILALALAVSVSGCFLMTSNENEYRAMQNEEGRKVESELVTETAPETEIADEETETVSGESVQAVIEQAVETGTVPETEPSSVPSQTSAPEPVTVKEPETTQAPITVKEPETTQAPTTQAPETQPPTTQAPETQPPTTQEPETQPPETTAAPHKHSYTSTVTKQSTCRETGVRTYTCSCGSSYTETIPVTDHHYVEKQEESTVTVIDSEEFTVDVVPCIPRYFVSYKQNEDGSWDFLGTWQDTMKYGVPQTEWFYGITENYAMENGHNSNELIAYMRSAGYRYIYTAGEDPADACDNWLRCIGEFSDGQKNPDHGFREGYGPCWWVSSWDITVPAVTHQETVTNTYYECSVCGHRK